MTTSMAVNSDTGESEHGRGKSMVSAAVVLCASGNPPLTSQLEGTLHVTYGNIDIAISAALHVKGGDEVKPRWSGARG